MKKNQSSDSSNIKFGKIEMQIYKTTTAIKHIQPWKLLTYGGSLEKIIKNNPYWTDGLGLFWVLFSKELTIRSLSLCKYELCWPTFLITAVQFILYHYTDISMNFTSTLCV